MDHTNTDDRVAALEARIRDLETQTAARSVKPEFEWKTWAEKYGLLIAWIAVIIIMGAFKPAQMFAWNSYATMLGSNAMVVVLTLALIIPLTTGDFDLSVAATMGLSSMVIAVLNVKMGLPISSAIIAALLTGVAVGIVNAFFIIYFGVFSLIVTLGTGYFISGLILWVADSGTVAGVSMSLIKAVILTRFLGIPVGFYYALLLTGAIWYLFQYTALGRRMLFVGRGREVARLSGVNVNRMRAGALIASSTLAAFAGVLYTGMRGVADPSSALAFLLPAFAAAFLGSTTIYPGRFNAPGAFVAVYFLSTGIMGLNFLGVDSFVQNLFYGGGLVLAVAISQLIRGRKSMD
ncbi:ABC transporter permease [Sulfitobacter noctilucicola]|uniref:Ribose transport system permease protein n=1 Tax=Sulfitobacter noctilucicola TaxID=1342301 RepID=A0A7W6MAM6_9RHOB|nr:ABC transporter permease [Sulfitobacter noctilucicola]KIN64085.1 ABC transporter permease [Sulfitobacter noctilucicola]MBB4175439.1 ribose transport system permease protein [Sulfitobacter noctilucicola]